MFTSRDRPDAANPIFDQRDEPPVTAERCPLPSYDDSGRSRRKNATEKEKGGWGYTIELSVEEVKSVYEVAHLAVRNSTPLNRMVTARAPNGIALPGAKRKLATLVARIGQALQRRGHDHIGITTYERKRGEDYLHAHHALHVPRTALDVIDRFTDDDAVKATSTHRHTLGYLTKQRQQLSPDFERTTSLFRRQPGDYIPGSRLSITKSAMALLSRREKPKRRRTASPPTMAKLATADKPPDLHPDVNTEAAEQLTLPLLAAPVIDIFAAAETKRKTDGLTQTEAAHLLGIRQSHWSNSIVRHHDTLSPWAINRVRDYLADRLAA